MIANWARILLAGALVTTACGVPNGDGAAASGIIEYQSRDGTFAITYVSPPWMVQEETSTSLQLIVPAEIFSVELEGSPPTHAMLAGHVDEIEGLDELIASAGGFTPDGGPPDVTGDFGFSFDFQIPDLSIESGGPDIPEIPDYLLDVDLTNERDVAFAELNYLIEFQEAELERELTTFVTDSGAEGVVYEVVIKPGVFIRSFYFPCSARAIRFAFVSLFQLDTRDIDLMAETIQTDMGGL